MARLEWLVQHRAATALLVGAIAGLGIGALLPASVGQKGLQATRGWQLPAANAVARVSEAEFARVRAAPIWGASAGGPAAVKAASWKLVAIMNQPQPVALVVAGKGPDVLHLKAGDRLPDGGAVGSVGPNGLTFVRDGCSFERVLYSAVDSPIAGSCAAAKPAASAPSPEHPAK